MATRAQRIAPAKMLSSRYPTLPKTEAELHCQNKRRLLRSFKQAEAKFVADWLLSVPTQTFHHRLSIPHTAFEHALGIHATLSTTPPSSGPGSDILIVPFALHHGRLLGYTFGGMSKQPNGDSCPYGGPSYPLFPHFVGRFSFDINAGDFLAFIHRIAKDASGVMHIRRDGENRDRNLFLVGAGDYGYERLPGKLLSLITGQEKRKSSNPKYQFSIGGSGEHREMNDALARLERLLKGDFACSKQRRDDMDPSSGEVLNRCTMATHARFDVMDAVGLQRAKEHAVRIYYRYMSGISGASSSKQSL